MPTNVLGAELKCCCRDPVTGFFRDGFCRTGPEDIGLHTVCVKVTREFLDFSVLDGNDLVTPVAEWNCLRAGERARQRQTCNLGGELDSQSTLCLGRGTRIVS